MMRRAFGVVALFAIGGAMGCADADLPDVDTGLEELQVSSVNPQQILPKTRLAVVGRQFVPRDEGETTLRLQGTFRGASGTKRKVDFTLAPAVKSDKQLELVADEAFLKNFPEP